MWFDVENCCFYIFAFHFVGILIFVTPDPIYWLPVSIVDVLLNDIEST